MEFKSEYYRSWEERIKEENLDLANADVIEASTQSYEEMVFAFTMWLVM